MFENIIGSNGMLISGLILLIAYVFIATEKIQKSVIALSNFPTHDIIDTYNGKLYQIAIKRWNHET